MATNPRVQQLIADLRQYAETGENEEMRPRCATAAQSIQGGCNLIALRDQLSVEVYNGDTSTAAWQLVNIAVFGGVESPKRDHKEIVADLYAIADRLHAIEDELFGTGGLEMYEARRHLYAATNSVIVAGNYLEGKK